jgi:hypothetical protein
MKTYYPRTLHRGHHHAPLVTKPTIIKSICFLVLWQAFMIAVYPQQIKMLFNLSYKVLTQLVEHPIPIVIANKQYLWTTISFIEIIPNISYAGIPVFALLGTGFLLWRLFFNRTTLVVNVVIGLFLSLTLASSLFPFFSGGAYPYTIKDFYDFYFYTESTLTYAIPLVLGTCLLTNPTPFWSKYLYALLMSLFFFTFGMARYLIIMYFMVQGHFYLLPLFVFFFGPLIDFLLLVGSFTNYVAIMDIKPVWRTAR